MVKKTKEIRPFFTLRWEINDTLEALSNEILMQIQAMEMAIRVGGMNDAGNKIMNERIIALKKICMEDGGE